MTRSKFLTMILIFSFGCASAPQPESYAPSIDERQAYLEQQMAKIEPETPEELKADLEPSQSKEDSYDLAQELDEGDINDGVEALPERSEDIQSHKPSFEEMAREVRNTHVWQNKETSYSRWQQDQKSLNDLTIGMGVGLTLFILGDVASTAFYALSTRDCIGLNSADRSPNLGACKNVPKSHILMSWTWASTGVFLAGLIGAAAAKTIHENIDPSTAKRFNFNARGLSIQF